MPEILKQYSPMLDGALQFGNKLRTKGWPPGATLQSNFSFRLWVISNLRGLKGSIELPDDCPTITFNVVAESLVDESGCAKLSIEPALTFDTSDQALLLIP